MKKIITIFVGVAILLLPAKSFAKDQKQDALTLDEVVRSAVKNYPIIFSHYDKIRAAESNLLAAKGFFDIRLKQNYSNRTRGYYDGKTYDAEIEKHLGILGSKVYGGYRKSYGKFADYEAGSITNSGGEFRAGAKFSLLKDRDIDQNRLSLILGNLGIEEAKIELENIKMEITRDASKAYWSWVCAGKILQIYEDLYQLSLNRQNQLEVKAQKGDIAQIVVVENKKNLLKRKTSLAKIRQEFDASSVYLSLFWRDNSGNPTKPEKINLPEIATKLSDIPNDNEIKNAKNRAIFKRPEIRLINIKSNQQSEELKYAKNLMQPQLDVEFGASKDEGSGSASRAQANNYANFNFSLPLQQREGKGKVAAAESKISAIKYEKSLLEDQINVEIDQIMIKISTISETYSLLVEEAKLAEVLQNSELEKFKHGASNFFLVNLREQDLAASKAAVIEVFKEFNNTKADYQLAVFDYIEY
ncbi:MAG: TolC family protein [Rickettsiales bacterium]|nr:TolC family protein [Rickettsiales bacterium]